MAKKKTVKQRILKNMRENPSSRTDDVVLIGNMIEERIDPNLVTMNMMRCVRPDVKDNVLNSPSFATSSRTRRILLNEQHKELQPPDDYNQRTNKKKKGPDEYMENVPNFMMVVFKPESFSQVNPQMAFDIMKSNFFKKNEEGNNK